MGDKKVTYPAEFAYGIISSKWVFKNFKKIGLIRSNEKLKIINELMKYEEYQNYLELVAFQVILEFLKSMLFQRVKVFIEKLKRR